MLVIATAAVFGILASDVWLVPRTPDGKPDLQGVWTNATVTPLERPRELAAREVYSDEEMEAVRKAAAEPVPTAQRGGTEAHYDFTQFGLDRTQSQIAFSKRTSLIVGPEGRVPPTTPAAQQRNTERAAANRGHEFDGPENRPIQERCIIWANEGPPMLPPGYNSFLQIVQTPGYVVILQEMIHDARVIPIGTREHLPPALRRWQGDSIGRWEGDTLVVDTTNFTEKTRFRGSSETLHVVERFTRVDAKNLLYRFTIEDSETWTRPWTGEYTWPITSELLYEYACHEGNYAMGNILRGARLKEADDAKKK